MDTEKIHAKLSLFFSQFYLEIIFAFTMQLKNEAKFSHQEPYCYNFIS